MGFRPMFLVQGSWCGNALVFATKEEAEQSARARFQVWTMPTDCRAEECPDAPNYERVNGADRPLIQKENPADSSSQPQPEKSMSIKDQAHALALSLSTLSSEITVKVCLVFVKAGLTHWRQEATKHHTTMLRYPEGSKMRQQADSAYGTAFGHWHRLSMLNKSLGEVLTHPTYGTPNAPKAAEAA